MSIPYSYFLLFFFIHFHYGSAINRTQVCVNINASDVTNEPIQLSASNFVEFIQKSAFYIDKSLLLFELLYKTENITTKVITAPSKWGKTLNLKMIEFFSQIETDQDGNRITTYETSAYKYFALGIIPGRKYRMENPPLIFKHTKFIHKYLGKYPVIYIDFANLEPEESSFYSVLDAFSQLVSEIFSKYSYVRKMWDPDLQTNKTEVKKMMAREKLIRYDKFLAGTIKDVHKLTHSISFLAETLYEFFGTKPIILHDKYDKLVNYLYFEKNGKFNEECRERVRSFFIHFMSSTYRIGQRSRLAIMTGVLNLEKGTFFPKVDLYECSVFDEEIIYPFYGFSKREILSLMEKRGLEHEEKDIDKFYTGYKIIDQQDELYNPWMIANYINKKKLANYWNDDENRHVIENLCFYRKSRNLLESLVGKKIYSISKGKVKIGCNQCEALTKLIDRTAERNESSSLTYTNLLSYFYNLGYLSPVEPSLPLRLQLIDSHMSHYLANELLNFYSYLLKDKHILNIITEKCVQILHDFIFNDESSSSDLSAIINDIFKNIGTFPHKKVTRVPGQKPLKARKLMRKGEINGNQELVRTIMLIPAIILHVNYNYDLRIEETFSCIVAETTQQEGRKKIALVIETKHVGEENPKVRTTRKPFIYSYHFGDESEIDVIKYLEVRVRNDASSMVIYSMKTKDNLQQNSTIVPIISMDE